MKLIVFSVGGLFALGVALLWLMNQIHYRIGSTHLKILLFGLTVRKIDLTDIKRVSKRKPTKAAEYWYNTLKPSHRLLSIQRQTGLRRCVVITPRNRYIFLADLQNAIKRAKPDANLDAIMESSSQEASA